MPRSACATWSTANSSAGKRRSGTASRGVARWIDRQALEPAALPQPVGGVGESSQVLLEETHGRVGLTETYAHGSLELKQLGAVLSSTEGRIRRRGRVYRVEDAVCVAGPPEPRQHSRKERSQLCVHRATDHRCCAVGRDAGNAPGPFLVLRF